MGSRRYACWPDSTSRSLSDVRRPEVRRTSPVRSSDHPIAPHGTWLAPTAGMAKNTDNQRTERTRTPGSAEGERDVADQNDRADERIVGETSDEDEDDAFEEDEDEDEEFEDEDADGSA